MPLSDLISNEKYQNWRLAAKRLPGFAGSLGMISGNGSAGYCLDNQW